MGAPLEAAAHKLLDFSQPTDVALLDSTVATFYGAGSAEEVRQMCYVDRSLAAKHIAILDEGFLMDSATVCLCAT